MAGKGPISSIGSVIGWILVVAIVVAIMILWNWDPIAFVSNSINRISEIFLGWEWFRKLVGAE